MAISNFPFSTGFLLKHNISTLIVLMGYSGWVPLMEQEGSTGSGGVQAD
jgi:hypothetical protein